MRLRRAVLLISGQALLGACAAAPEPASVPFTRAFGLVFVEVAPADGEAPLLALLDTGANASAIDPRRAGHLPSLGASEVVGTTGTLAVEMVEVANLCLGAVPLPVLRATRRDLGGLLAPEGRRVDMILGSDAFAGRVLTIDFTARTLRLHGPASAASEVTDASVPMQLDNGIPTLPADLAGTATTLRIDTGASLFDTEDVYVNVPTHLWQALQARHPALAPTSHLSGTGASGETVSLPVVPLPHARIGPRTLDRVFLIVQPELGYFATPDAKGFVGNNFLEKLGCVQLDYGAGRFRVP